ncbi:phospho-sugar mutase [Mycoplasma sp. 613B]
MLEFGTAGIRGKLGNKESELNTKHVYRIIDGYARYLLKNFANVKQQGVVIGRDNRNKSFIFLKLATQILSKNYGIKVYTSKQPIATPVVSFLIKQKQAIGGINITASHNPKEYNGIKIYNKFGAQILPDEVKKLIPFFKKYNKINNNLNTKKINFNKKVICIDKYLPVYVQEISRIFSNNLFDNNLKIAYSPLHGTGSQVIKLIEKQTSVKFLKVESEMKNSKHFNFVSYPNPEEKSAYINLIDLMKRNKIKYGILTDPDADRIGFVEQLSNNEFYYFTGNELATIIFNFLVEENYYKENDLLIYSFVSSNLPSIIANKHNIKSQIIPTGFKWVGPEINKYKEKSHIFAFEESYGSLINSDISFDKDAFQSLILILNILSKKRNISFLEELNNIYKKYGFIFSKVVSIELNSMEPSKINSYLESFLKINFSLKISKIIDYRKGYNNIVENMVQIFFENNSWAALRPSGTEPKIKLYIFSLEKNKSEAQNNLDKILKQAKEIFIK